MQFTGSLEIEAFKKIGMKRSIIKREIRDASYRAFTYAVGAMLLEIGRQVPYLTGATRGAIQQVLNDVDAKIAQYGGLRAYSNKLRMSTTLRKMRSGAYPQYSSNLYAVKYTRTYRGGRKIASRGDWRDYLMDQGQNEDSEKGNTTGEFQAIGSTTYGRLAFHFRLAVNHWTKYELEGVHGKPVKGPWHVIKDGRRVFDETIRELLPEVSSLSLRIFPQRKTSSDPDEALQRLRSWQPHGMAF